MWDVAWPWQHSNGATKVRTGFSAALGLLSGWQDQGAGGGGVRGDNRVQLATVAVRPLANSTATAATAHLPAEYGVEQRVMYFILRI